MPGCSSNASRGGRALARCGGPAGAGSPRREKAALGARVGSPILPPSQGQLYSCDSPAKAPRPPFAPSVCWACKQISQQLQARQSLAHRVRDSVSSGAAEPRQGQRPKLTCHSHSRQDRPDQCPDVLCTPRGQGRPTPRAPPHKSTPARGPNKRGPSHVPPPTT